MSAKTVLYALFMLTQIFLILKVRELHDRLHEVELQTLNANQRVGNIEEHRFGMKRQDLIPTWQLDGAP
jgi:hypothetical protein